MNIADVYASLISLLLLLLSLAPSVLLQEPSEEYGWLLVGGSFAKKHEFPWMVRIYSDIPDTDTYSCGGTLIANNLVLTAGHCLFNGVEKANTIRLYFGKHDLSIVNEPAEIYRGVSDPADIQIHPDFYASANTNFDFGIIRLQEPVPLSEAIKPIRLPLPSMCTKDSLYFDDMDMVDGCQEAVATGWGRPGPADYMTFVLKKIDVSVVPFWHCTSNFINDYFTKAKICASGNKGQQTCRGDSGGPLMCQHGDYQYLFGVTSYGSINCAQTDTAKAGVYSRVCAALPWLRGIIQKYASTPGFDVQPLPSISTTRPVIVDRFTRPTVPAIEVRPISFFYYPPNARNPYFIYPKPGSDCNDPNYVILKLLENSKECDVDNLPITTLLGAFFSAIRGSFTDVVRKLMDAGVGPNSSEYYPDYGYAQPALILAARWDRLDIIKLLLERGASLELKDSRYNRTALIWSVCDRKINIIQYLINQGASTTNCNCGRDGVCDRYLNGGPESIRVPLKENTRNIPASSETTTPPGSTNRHQSVKSSTSVTHPNLFAYLVSLLIVLSFSKYCHH